MKSVSNDVEQLIDEHQTLLRHYGKTQSRCSDLLSVQAAELVTMQRQVFRLRAAVVVRETALAWERMDRAALEAAIPGLPHRMVLMRRIDRLVGRIQELMRERLRWQWHRPAAPAPRSESVKPVEEGSDTAVARPIDVSERMEDTLGFEASLIAADLVICQTGCLSHDAYWRVQDHCKRTGKACVVVAQPDAVRIVRIHKAQCDDAAPDARPAEHAPVQR